MSPFKNLILHPVDPIFGLQQIFVEDPRDSKINLIVGVYLSPELKPFVLPCVKEAERRLLDSETSKNYLPIAGSLEYTENCERLIFSDELPECIAAQTVGGTGALAIGARLLKQAGKEVVGISAPSWLNHHAIFANAGLAIHEYPYYSYEKKCLDFGALLRALDHLPKESALLLQPTCHNPTGNDLSKPQWEELIAKIEKRRFIPFFDCAYQGFGHGLNEDVYPIQMMAKTGRPFLVSISHSKNFGLYCERTGALLIYDTDLEAHSQTFSNLKATIRAIHSNCPAHGAKIVNTIMGDSALRKQWEIELTAMRTRIQSMRALLCDELDRLLQSTDHQFTFMRNQVGMFSYTGLAKSEVERLRDEYAIFMPTSGRINVAGMNAQIIPKIAQAFVEVSQ